MIASVLVEIKSKQIDKYFDYLIPEELKSTIKVGVRVLVPFGMQELEGYVIQIHNTKDKSLDYKYIHSQIDEEVVLNEELREIGKKMVEDNLVSLSSAYSTMLPSALKAKKSIYIPKKYDTILKLNMSLDEAYSKCKSKSQFQIIEAFELTEKLTLTESNKISSSSTKTLLKNKILIAEKQEHYRYQIKEYEMEKKKKLTDEQQLAYSKILNHLNEAKTIVLKGVTGSGKTEIYMQIIENVLKLGKTSLILVPEISLTPQFVYNFAKRFGNQIALLHSGLSDGEKYDEWRKIMRNEASIVIGARSSIFAPLKNIGIIIVDECHSDSYKQENRPKYQVSKIAEYRSKYHNCPVIFGSATPTLELISRAKKGVFELIELNQRVNQQPLPKVTLVDMKEEIKKKHNIISSVLEEKIEMCLQRKEQILILLNRRGYSTTIQCSNCGYTYRCPYCDITLTYHKSSKNLRCHYCGYTKYIDNVCPSCKEEALNYYGLGTEKLEAFLTEKFSNAKIVRMDTDTTSKKGSLERITNDFRDQKYDILIGTQMISKGLDFPNVTLVGIVGADNSFNIPDFRSGEKSFALLYQASGRAGRSNLTGEVIIETFNPDNTILNCVKNQDFEQFYQYEMNIRHKLRYPPYYYLANLVIKSKEYNLAKEEANKVATYLKKNLDSTSIVLGPSTASLFRVNNVYHFEIMVKYRFDSKIKNVMKELDQIFLLNKKVELDVDLFY